MSGRTTQVGPYRLLGKLGKGGMATVFHALDTRSGLQVALKILLPQFYNDTNYVKRFTKEGNNTRRLRHPHIVRTLDAGVADGYYFISMELVDNGTLDRYVQLRGGKLPLDEVLYIISQIGQALDYAHSLGYIHRDIKPNNILCTTDGRYMLSDFGIAKHLSNDITMMTVGASIGTPSYMSPEQARSERTVNHRSDIYSLGVLTYRLLTGEFPFQAKEPYELVHKIIYQNPIDPRHFNPQVPECVAQAIMRVLTKDPEERYDTCEGFVNGLRSYTQPESLFGQMGAQIVATIQSSLGLGWRSIRLARGFKSRQSPPPITGSHHLQLEVPRIRPTGQIAIGIVSITLMAIWLLALL
ncbi:MAG: serine/threonine-protein kinase [Chloroflexota bacterium]